MANFEKFGHFLTALAMKNAFGYFVKLVHFLAIFLVCHCRIKFSLNIVFCIFWTVFMSLIGCPVKGGAP